VALEADQMIFEAILEPLIVDSVSESFKKQRLDVQVAFEILEDEDLAESVIIPRHKFCK
jgi:hypothetical protein